MYMLVYKELFQGCCSQAIFFFLIMFYVKYVSDTVKKNNNKKNAGSFSLTVRLGCSVSKLCLRTGRLGLLAKLSLFEGHSCC